MKKIKNIKELKAQKEKLKHRNAELEKALKYDWRDLKDTVLPKNILGRKISNIFNDNDKKEKRSFIANTISTATTFFTDKIAEKAGDTIDKWFKK